MMDAIMQKTIQEYFKTRPVEKVWIFGSFSRGEEKPNSDVDMIVRFVPGARMGLSFCAMICELEDLLHRPVDIVREGCILPFAAENADHDKVLVYERAS